MLEHGLARAEGPGGAEGPAHGHREEGVDGPLLGDEGLFREQLFGVVRNGDLHRLELGHGDLALFAPVVHRFGHGVVDGEFARVGDLFEFPLALPVEGDHDVVGDDPFGDRTDPVTGPDSVAGLGDGGPGPLRFPVQRSQIDAPLKEEPGVFRQQIQRVLESVVDLLQQARAQFHAQQFAGELHPVADLEAGSAFEDLKVRPVAPDPDDFAFEAAAGHVDVGHLVLHDFGGEFNGDHVAVDADDLFQMKILRHK